jgi:ubiquinone/menaquinone biosynthesis C-methylase UbiE
MQTTTLHSRLISLTLSVFFNALYHPFAWTYDWVAAIVSLGRWKSWVLSVLPDLPGPRVLEVGHGPGHLQIAMAHKGLTAYGIDQSRQMGRIAQRRMDKTNFTSRLVNARGQFLPFANAAFDQVVSTFPTPYLFHTQTLEEIYRVLAPAGTCIVIPEAWITGSTLLDQAASGTFRLLGQTYEWDDRYIAPFVEVGFATSTVRRKLASSEVMLIRAIKQADHP